MKFKKVIITGGSRGIGKTLVDHFLKEKCEVHVVARVEKNKSTDPNLHFHSVDLSVLKKTEEFADSFLLEHGVPDLLVNNAGSGAFYDWGNFPESEIYNQMNLLFSSPVLLCRKFAPRMFKQQKGIIVNISSLATLYPVPYMPIYNAGKSALSSYTRSMILEFDKFPKFLDLVIGDVCTDFNNEAAKSKQDNWSERMQVAWRQIERQLSTSPKPSVIGKEIIRIINNGNSGLFYLGSLFHRLIYPFLFRLLSFPIVKKVLRKRYFS